MKWTVTMLILAMVMVSGCSQQVVHDTLSTNSYCSGTARCFNGTVTRIVDGDTLYVGNSSIRLALVNASEGDDDATNFTSTICPVGSAAIVDEDDKQTKGSYGRIVGVVYCNGVNLNAELIDKGKATLYESFCSKSEFATEAWTGC
jgi:micrococcal nuclease